MKGMSFGIIAQLHTGNDGVKSFYMSGIFGLINFDGALVSKDEITSMRSAMAEWGPDRSAVWLEGPAGLGSLILFNTPEALNEKMPVQSGRGFVLTAEGRLDNRVELFPLLGISAQDGKSMPDGEIILRSYEKWGEKTPHFLIGDWSFAAWHPNEKKLFLARDHSGNTALYYYHDEHRFAFASSKKALMALGIPNDLNEFYLACVLVSWPAHHGPKTINLNIQRIPPAHTLTLQGNQFKVDQYWRLEDMPLMNLKNPNEYIEGFLSIYDRAIRDRLRSPRGVGVTLSGGLDSGSVTAFMARAMKERNQRLNAYTSVPIYDVANTMNLDLRFGDELPFAKSVAEFAGNVDLIEIRAKNVSIVQSIRRGLDIHDTPAHAAGNMYWIYDLLENARKDGVNSLLTGQGGNATISWNGVNKTRQIKNLLKKGGWRQVLHLVLFPLIPLPMLRSFYDTFRKRKVDWSGTSINLEFAKRIDLASQYIQHIGTVVRPEGWQSPLLQRYSIIKPSTSFLGDIWAENSAAYQMEVRDPTLDKRVMEFMLAIPDREYTGPDETDRWIIRKAMEGIMPDDVRLNQKRGSQAGDLGQRMLDTASEVESTLSEVESSKMAKEYLDVERIRRVWEALKKEINIENSNRAVTILTRGMMAGMYLSDLEKAK